MKLSLLKKKEKKERKKNKNLLKKTKIPLDWCSTFHIARNFRRCEKPSGLHIPWLEDVQTAFQPPGT